MIPLIRAGAILPFVRWMQAQNRPVEDSLSAVDLGYLLKGGPNLPIALVPAVAFVRAASRIEGPDFPCRIVSRSSVRELGIIGEVALGAGTVREALFHVAASLPQHVTSGVVSVRCVPGGVLLREVWGMRADDESLHLMQQYAAALFQALCTNAGAPAPLFSRVALVPHPVHGLAHLRGCFGDAVERSPDRALELSVPTRVADQRLPSPSPHPPPPETAGDHAPLRSDGTLSASVRIVMEAMMLEGTPTVDRIAATAGLSVRTLQRLLGEERKTFSGLLDAVRRDLALAALAGGPPSAGRLARELGYCHQSSLTRAVRRWTGSPPTVVAPMRKT